jgi:riboflavin kinase/FMN adenylyltransferase
MECFLLRDGHAQSVERLDGGAVVAIGNFDAVHLGHQALLAEAKRQAVAQNVPLAVLTFEPHPRRIFRADDPPFRVTPLAVKLDRFAACGVEQVYVCPFNWELAALSPEDFTRRILIDQLHPHAIVVGHDFHFGHNRAGNAAFLRQFGLQVTDLDLLSDGHRAVISATRIRGAIQAGHIDEANAMLGWDWDIRGVVGHGDKRGREIGYPTANVPLGETIHPAYGIYATWVMVEGECIWRKAATNIGIRPMFELQTGLVEAHILDYAGDLYSKVLRIRPVKKIRDEMKFTGLDALVSQIDQDCITAREILG